MVNTKKTNLARNLLNQPFSRNHMKQFISDEIKVFSDILVVNVIDSYMNLTLKSVFILKYLSDIINTTYSNSILAHNYVNNPVCVLVENNNGNYVVDL